MNLVVIIPYAKFADKLAQIIKEIYDESMKVCYVSLNKPYKALKYMLLEQDIDISKFFVIDGVTKTVIRSPERIKNCVFVDGPTALDALNEEIKIMISKEKIDALVFDSLSTLFVYEKQDMVLNYIRTFFRDLAVDNCIGVFVCLKEDMTANLKKEFYLSADKIIDLTTDAKIKL